MNGRKARAIRKMVKLARGAKKDWKVGSEKEVSFFHKTNGQYETVKRQVVVNATKYHYRKTKKVLKNIVIPTKPTGVNDV